MTRPKNNNFRLLRLSNKQKPTLIKQILTQISGCLVQWTITPILSY
ncbi:MAG: hypothetical protein V7K42_27500 [Nostoc sp.]